MYALTIGGNRSTSSVPHCLGIEPRTFLLCDILFSHTALCTSVLATISDIFSFLSCTNHYLMWLIFGCLVLSAFPLCHLTEDDLVQNPLFCKLLATLSQHVDRTGLTLPLRKELEKVTNMSKDYKKLTFKKVQFPMDIRNAC